MKCITRNQRRRRHQANHSEPAEEDDQYIVQDWEVLNSILSTRYTMKTHSQKNQAMYPLRPPPALLSPRLFCATIYFFSEKLDTKWTELFKSFPNITSSRFSPLIVQYVRKEFFCESKKLLLFDVSNAKPNLNYRPKVQHEKERKAKQVHQGQERKNCQSHRSRLHL